MPIQERVSRAVDFLLDIAWVLAALTALVYGLLSRFVPKVEIPGSAIFGLVGLVATGLWKALRKLEKRAEEHKVIIERELHSLKDTTERELHSLKEATEYELHSLKDTTTTVGELLKLGAKDTQSVIRFARQTAGLARIKELSDAPVHEILKHGMADIEARYEAYSGGQIDVPIAESPAVNYEIIETFSARMDAVSRDDIKFWVSPFGQEYLRKSREAIGRASRSRLTRIFVFGKDYLSENMSKILTTLKRHLQLEIGFAIVVENSLKELKRTHGIQVDKERAPQLDFALFDTDRAVTFFRGDGEMRRFRAYFKVSDPNNVNNEMIQKQRSIWVDLINQAWLVSNHFKAQIGLSDNPPTGLSDEERKRIETAARKDFAELKLRMPTFSPDDDWFPLVVGNDEELETKIKRVKVLFEEFHRTDVDTGRLDRSEAS